MNSIDKLVSMSRIPEGVLVISKKNVSPREVFNELADLLAKFYDSYSGRGVPGKIFVQCDELFEPGKNDYYFEVYNGKKRRIRREIYRRV